MKKKAKTLICFLLIIFIKLCNSNLLRSISTINTDSNNTPVDMDKNKDASQTIQQKPSDSSPKSLNGDMTMNNSTIMSTGTLQTDFKLCDNKYESSIDFLSITTCSFDSKDEMQCCVFGTFQNGKKTSKCVFVNKSSLDATIQNYNNESLPFLACKDSQSPNYAKIMIEATTNTIDNKVTSVANDLTKIISNNKQISYKTYEDFELACNRLVTPKSKDDCWRNKFSTSQCCFLTTELQKIDQNRPQLTNTFCSAFKTTQQLDSAKINEINTKYECHSFSLSIINQIVFLMILNWFLFL